MKKTMYPWQTCIQTEQNELEKWRYRFGVPILVGLFYLSSAHVALAHEEPPHRENEPGDQYPDDWCTPYDGICDGPCDEIDPDCESGTLFEEGIEDEEIDTVEPETEEPEEDPLIDCPEEEAVDVYEEDDPYLEDEEASADVGETEEEIEEDDLQEDEPLEEEWADEDEPLDEDTPLEYPEEELDEDECLMEHPEDLNYGDEEILLCEGAHDEEYFEGEEGEKEADATIDINVNGCSKTTPAGMLPGFALLSALAFIQRKRRRMAV